MQTIKAPMQVIDAGTGQVKEEKTMDWHLVPPPANCCQVCGHQHEPHLPHNRDSLYYQMAFNAEHGRYPTWIDATAHCSTEMQKLWTDVLKEMGVDVEGGKINPESN